MTTIPDCDYIAHTAAKLALYKNKFQELTDFVITCPGSEIILSGCSNGRRIAGAGKTFEDAASDLRNQMGTPKERADKLRAEARHLQETAAKIDADETPNT